MFIEFQPPPDSDWGAAYMLPRTFKFFYYIAITTAFCANISVVSHTTLLSLMGSSLALRGPDGSMITATDGLYEERQRVFRTFGIGLACTVGSTVLVVWLMLSPEAAVVCFSIAVFTCIRLYSDYIRVDNKFAFDERETVDFNDIFEGPAAIMAVPQWIKRSKHSSKTKNRYENIDDEMDFSNEQSLGYDYDNDEIEDGSDSARMRKNNNSFSTRKGSYKNLPLSPTTLDESSIKSQRSRGNMSNRGSRANSPSNRQRPTRVPVV